MPRTKGSVNRNYPSVSLEEALDIPRAIQDGASGMPVSKLTLAELVDRSPASSGFRERLLASRAYGLTVGGVNSQQFELTELGNAATGADEDVQREALRRAALNVEPFRAFLTAYNGKKVPATTPFMEFLVQSAAVPPERAEECVRNILRDAAFVGHLRDLKGAKYIDLAGVDLAGPDEQVLLDDEIVTAGSPTEESGDESSLESSRLKNYEAPPKVVESDVPKKVFIAHGKNRVPLDQLKKMLDQFKVKYAVAVDEPHQGRPISAKVANLMRGECSSAIFIFTADEMFLQRDEDGNATEVWRPSENVVYELGAASILYDRRIVIFKEKRVTFPSDFSDLGYIEFEQDQLVEQMGSLFSELVSLDILEVRAKGQSRLDDATSSERPRCRSTSASAPRLLPVTAT